MLIRLTNMQIYMSQTNELQFYYPSRTYTPLDRCSMKCHRINVLKTRSKSKKIIIIPWNRWNWNAKLLGSSLNWEINQIGTWIFQHFLFVWSSSSVSFSFRTVKIIFIYCKQKPPLLLNTWGPSPYIRRHVAVVESCAVA